MNLIHKTKIVLSRIETLHKSILIPAFVFIISIFFIELKLKYIPAYNEIQYNLWQIYLKICYSFTAATLFYFIVVHLPREKRKLKSVRYINNKSANIAHEISSLLITIGDRSGIALYTVKPNLQEYEKACGLINPQNKLWTINEPNVLFNNWFEYINFKGENIRKLISELFVLNDILDPEYFQLLTFIDDEVSTYMIFKSFPDNTDLGTWSRALFSIAGLSHEMTTIIREKLKRYEFEYRDQYGKRIKKASTQ